MRYRAWLDLSTGSGEPILARISQRGHGRRGRARAVFGAALFAAALAAAGCAVNPVTGQQELSLVSTAEEIAMGEQTYAPLQQTMGGLYKADPELTRYVAEIGRRVAAFSDRALPYEFVVLNTGAFNAWALPGGKVGITRGLLLELENEAELAAILGHEIVHAAARHGAQSQQRGMLGELVLTGLAIAAQDSVYADLIVAGSDVALQFVDRKYGRDAERESDYYGMKYMHAAGYDTAAAVTLQQKFLALTKGDRPGWLAGLFASHPPSDERVENNRAALAKFPPGGALKRGAYAERLAYLRARGRAYEDADRAAELIRKDPKAALRAIADAIAREPNEALFHGIRGWILAGEGLSAAAVGAFDAAILRDSGYYAHYLGRGMAHADLGNRGRARDDLRRSHRLLPTAHASYELGRIALSDGGWRVAKRHFEAAIRAPGQTGRLAREAYARLDLADAPERYFTAEPIAVYGEILVRVTNLSGIAVRDIELSVAARIDGVPQYIRTSRLRHLPAGGYADARTGLYYVEGQGVEVLARVVRARPADRP